MSNVVHSQKVAISALLLAVVCVSQPVRADTTLDFEGLGLAEYDPIPTTYGSHAATTPHVALSFNTTATGNFAFWDTGYGTLTNIGWFRDTVGPPNFASITLTADPGYEVSLTSFDMAGYPVPQDQYLRITPDGQTQYVGLIAIADGVTQWSAPPDATYPDYVFVDAHGVDHFVMPAAVHGHSITIEYSDDTGYPTSIAFVGIDNISFAEAVHLLGDVNGDCIVDVSDIQTVAANWLTAGPTGDANSDGLVDISDIQFIAAHWLQTCPAGPGASAVPEPPGLVLSGLAAAMALMSMARRRLCD